MMLGLYHVRLKDLTVLLVLCVFYCGKLGWKLYISGNDLSDAHRNVSIQGQDNLYVGVQRDLHGEGDLGHADQLFLLLMSIDVELATNIAGSMPWKPTVDYVGFV